jgi:hypothetical protein
MIRCERVCGEVEEEVGGLFALGAIVATGPYAVVPLPNFLLVLLIAKKRR